jgi:hypothetical protein
MGTCRDSSKARFEPETAGIGGGDPDGPARIRPSAQRNQAACHGSRRSPAGPARSGVKIPRVSGNAMEPVSGKSGEP